MKRQQYLLLAVGSILLIILFLLGQSSSKTNQTLPSKTDMPVTFNAISYIANARNSLVTAQQDLLSHLESDTQQTDISKKITAYHQLAHLWEDSLHKHEISLYYTAQTAKLENSEKSLTFAAHLLLNEVLTNGNAAVQNILAQEAKELFEKSLQHNAENDSSQVGLGACYIFANISDNPMKGISMIKKVTQKDSSNVYANYILALGGLKSGQLDKAITHFETVVHQQPDNMEAIFYLAETNEQIGDKQNAVKWYKRAKSKVHNVQIQEEIDNRINQLQ